MKNLTKALFALIVFAMPVVFFSCNCIEGEGPMVSQNRDLPLFSKIELRTNADVSIKQDSIFSLDVKAQANILEILKTKVRGETLIIDTENGCVRTQKGIEISISLPDLEGLEVDGSGSIFSQGSFTVDEIDVEINGSGEVHMDLVANDVQTQISGSGQVIYSGTAQNHKVGINGSGNVRAFGLKCYKASVKVTGSGDCELNVHKKLNAKISGSGDVRYKGSPDITTKISGSGTIDKQ